MRAQSPEQKKTIVLIGSIVGAIAAYAAVTFLLQGREPKLETFSPPDKCFRVLLPSPVTSQSQEVQTALGPIQIVLYQAKTRKLAFVAAYNDLGAASDTFDPKPILDGAQNGAVQNVNAKLLSEKDVEFHGIAGREFTAKTPQGIHLRQRIFFDGKRLYQLTASCKEGYASDPLISRVFDSYEILNPPQKPAAPEKNDSIDRRNARKGTA